MYIYIYIYIYIFKNIKGDFNVCKSNNKQLKLIFKSFRCCLLLSRQALFSAINKS